MKKVIFIFLLWPLAFVFGQWTQTFDPIKDIKITIDGRQLSQTNLLLVLHFQINGEAHIQKNDFFAIKSQNTNYIIQDILFPRPSQWEGDDVFQGKFDVKVKIKNKKLTSVIPLIVQYQCCEEKTGSCLLPVSRTINFTVQKKNNYALSVFGIIVLLILYFYFKKKNNHK